MAVLKAAAGDDLHGRLAPSRRRAADGPHFKAPVVIDVGPKATRAHSLNRRTRRLTVLAAATSTVILLQITGIYMHETDTLNGRIHLKGALQDEHISAQHSASMPSPPRAVPSSSEISFDLEPPVANDFGNVSAVLTIPKLIHQSWKDGGFPKTMFNWRWQANMIKLNPGWKHVQWTDKSSRELIAREYPWFLPMYDAYPSYIQRTDAARYFIMYHHGGVYADLDIECFQPFEPVLAGRRVVLSYKQGTNMSRGLVNAIFASEARHAFWKQIFSKLAERAGYGANAKTHVEVVNSTGPGLLRSVVEDLTRQRTLDSLGVALLHSRVWHPIMPEQKRGRDASAEAQRLINQSHCYHHFVSSWIEHDKDRHNSTLASRRGLGKASGTVPTGQSIRTSNPWRSFNRTLAVI